MRKLNSELLNFWIDNAHNKTVFCISVSAQMQRQFIIFYIIRYTNRIQYNLYKHKKVRSRVEKIFPTCGSKNAKKYANAIFL